MYILGINAYHADVSAVLLHDGQLVAAVEEERFRRIKHCAGFPEHAIRCCLQMAGIDGKQVDRIAVSRDPKAHLFRKAWFVLRNRPSFNLVGRRFANRKLVVGLPERIAASLGIDPSAARERMVNVEHHPAHLASTFLVSPFEESAICAIDGFGDFVSTSLAVGRGNQLRRLAQVYFPHSLGELYLAITQFLGFWSYGDEFKVMGLAPYGSPDFVPQLRELIHLLPNGLFELNLDYFQHWSRGESMEFEGDIPTVGPVLTPRVEELLGPARRNDEPIEPRHEAIAASLQVVFEEAVFHVLRELHRRTGLNRLCLAGGCAMNSVANGKIRTNTPFEEIYVQPAAGDNGTALGAAFYAWNQLAGKPRRFVMNHSLWGPDFGDQEIRDVVEKIGRPAAPFFPQLVENEDDMCREVASLIADGKIVGWFQGRMEWGARALGNRSILADPRRADMRDVINSKIKFREKFRPFAPAVLEEALDEYFAGAVPDPFMIQVYPVRPDKRRVIPAVTHVDGSGRLQTVSCTTNPRFWKLIRAFAEQTGVPVLLNTSFNENEPIVHTPEQALDCFLRTDMDVLVLGNWVLAKESIGKAFNAEAQSSP